MAQSEPPNDKGGSFVSQLGLFATLRRRLWISHSGAKLWDAPVDNRGVPFFMFIFDRSGPHSEITLHHFCRWEERAGLTGRIFNALPDGEPALFAAA